MIRKIAIILIVLMASQVLPAYGETSLSTAEATAEVQQIYIKEPTENIILLCDKKDFKVEAQEFKDFRGKYALLWTGIICVLVGYAYFKTKK